MYGLLKRDMQYIINTLNQFNEIDFAIIYGSRAIGNFKKGSDVDLAVSGEKVTDRVIYELNDLLNEASPLPYFFDIICLQNINNEKLLEHIKSEGKVFYKKTG
ncbi:nucleotidyltransferase domain-containing protein [Ralstonia pickettii]|nr:nucleotidyltransferase domain-containing protein [Ralstonia pickettii]